MHQTERRPVRRVVWAAGLLIAALTYGLLCLADLLLARWLDHQITQANAPARAIEFARVQTQDQPQLVAARVAGFQPLLFPALFEQAPFEALLRQHGVLPLGTQPSAALVYCNEGQGLVTYVSDRFGFRNADAAWDVVRPGIVLLGDSFVHGACVPDPDTIAARLAGVGHQVLSLGTAGNNALMHAAVANAFLPGLRPMHAVLVFYANDNEDEFASVLRPWALPAAPDYLIQATDGRRHPGPAYQRMHPLWAQASETARRQLNGGPSDQATRPLPRWIALGTMRALVYKAYRRWADGEPGWSSRLAIDTLADTCRRAGCRAALAYIPNSHFWRPDPRADGYKRALQAYAAARHPDLVWIDTSADLAVLGTAAYASKGGHLSTAGYAKVASAIDRDLRR